MPASILCRDNEMVSWPWQSFGLKGLFSSLMPSFCCFLLFVLFVRQAGETGETLSLIVHQWWVKSETAQKTKSSCTTSILLCQDAAHPQQHSKGVFSEVKWPYFVFSFERQNHVTVLPPVSLDTIELISVFAVVNRSGRLYAWTHKSLCILVLP